MVVHHVFDDQTCKTPENLRAPHDFHWNPEDRELSILERAAHALIITFPGLYYHTSLLPDSECAMLILLHVFLHLAGYARMQSTGKQGDTHPRADLFESATTTELL